MCLIIIWLIIDDAGYYMARDIELERIIRYGARVIRGNQGHIASCFN